MINRILHGSKKRWILIVAAVILLFIVLYVYNDYSSRKRYEEKAVMAKEYLDSGSFEKAQEAYREALSMDYGDKELMSIGLAEAYAGVHDYDKALEVLRSRYEIHKTTEVKEKIEEITAKKTDHRYYQLISYGDTYFSNGEYNKAIDEYEKAKLIKSKLDTSYIKIVESYIALEKYDLAKEEIQDGLALTDSERLKRLLDKVQSRINEIKYGEILTKASEYIYQENYEEAINCFNEAIWLLPKRDLAYNQMAEMYIILKDYDSAKALLQNYLRSNRSTTSQEVLNKIDDLIKKREEKKVILNELYTALSVVDIETITRILKDSVYMDIVAEEGTPFYYNPSGKTNLTMGYGLLISDKDKIYAGGFRNGMRGGIGIQFVWYGDVDTSWCYYQGEWNNDVPNGMGKAAEEGFITDDEGKLKKITIETSGMYSYGLENGTMTKTFYVDGVEKKVTYEASEGIPKVYVDDNSQTIRADMPNHYVIGQIYINNKPTGEYYSVKQGTKFMIKFLKD